MAESERVRIEALTVLAERQSLQDEVEKEQDMQAPPGLRANATSSSSATPLVQGLPHEQRTEASTSGLGFGISTDELLKRAADALATANIPPEWHFDLAPNLRDTAVFVTFVDAPSLRLAANKIRRCNISLTWRQRTSLAGRTKDKG